MLNNRLEGISTPSFYGHIKLLISESAALMRLAHQHHLVQNSSLSDEYASDALDRVQSASAMLSADEDCDVIKEAFIPGSRRLLYVTISFPRQTFVLACVDLPSHCFFCRSKIDYGFGSVPHSDYVSSGKYTVCPTCDCAYHEIHDNHIEAG